MIKRYFGGSKKYRICYLLIVKDDEVTISALYAKTGSKGIPNLTNEGRREAIKDAIASREAKSRMKVVPDSSKRMIYFKDEEDLLAPRIGGKLISFIYILLAKEKLYCINLAA